MRQTPEQLLKMINREEQEKHRGSLKIFFGYAAGVGKTYAMLEAAHGAKQRGVDVVAGYVEPHARPATMALLKGLELIPAMEIRYHGRKQNEQECQGLERENQECQSPERENQECQSPKRENQECQGPERENRVPSGILIRELDLDAVIRRHPQLVLVDELAHTNAEGCRHAKRYQDVEELLKEGIDVYTTVNVQHLESLNDIVAAITGVMVRERIPDSVFDNASQVEVVDIEPQELLERLNGGYVYKEEQTRKALNHFFTLDNLTALREITLRRCADRVNMISESGRIKNGGDYYTEEHILVCLSSSPSNPKIIRTAARMVSAFHSAFTALYVETPDFAGMNDEDKTRLQANMRLAEQLGAKIEIVHGEDIPFQIAEFARLSGVSKIVIGRNTAVRRHFFQKPVLTERLIDHASNLDIHIIPDSDAIYRAKRLHRREEIVFDKKEVLLSFLMLLFTTAIAFLFHELGFGEANIIMIYIFGVLLISMITMHQIYSLISSVISVMLFSFFFTEPRFTLASHEKYYPVTLVVMFASAFMTGSLAVRLKKQARQSARAAYRTQILFDTNHLLETASRRDEIIAVTAKQLRKLLGRDLLIYPSDGKELGSPQLFFMNVEKVQEAYESDDRKANGFYKMDSGPDKEAYISESEKAVAAWVLKNNKHAGATTDTLSSAKCLYLSIRVKDHVYGVVGIVVGEKGLDAFEKSILLSILGECALALENEKNRNEKTEVFYHQKIYKNRKYSSF